MLNRNECNFLSYLYWYEALEKLPRSENEIITIIEIIDTKLEKNQYAVHPYSVAGWPFSVLLHLKVKEPYARLEWKYSFT